MATAARGATRVRRAAGWITAFAVLLTPLRATASAPTQPDAPAPARAQADSSSTPAPARYWKELVRQVVDTSPSDAAAAAADSSERAQQMLRCFGLDTENYCLGLGFVDAEPSAAALVAAAAPRAAAEGGFTGGMSTADFVALRARMGSEQRLDAELAEMRTAWAGREKARRLRTGQVAVKREPPDYLRIMGAYGTSQERSYWCGPATFQSIDWADDKQKDTQASWAKDLGTTASGTAISAMVEQTNLKTTWDNYAGTYIVQNVGHWTPQKFFDIHRKHLGDGTGAPVIEHTQLLKRYFPYLAYDYSGHYQVGRGYNTKEGTITIFEVFNERRFNSRGNVTHGTQDIPYTALFNATLANKFQNIGL